MALKIDRRLNMVFEIARDDATIYVHAAPIGYDVFRNYFRVLSGAFNATMQEDAGFTGPRIAALELEEAARKRGAWDGVGGVRQGLFGEMHRLANVIAPKPDGGGWITLPFDSAVSAGLLSEDDIREVDSIMVFFTCVSHIALQTDRPRLLQFMQLWGTRTSSSNCTEFALSLPTLKPDANTGEKPAVPTLVAGLSLAS